MTSQFPINNRNPPKDQCDTMAAKKSRRSKPLPKKTKAKPEPVETPVATQELQVPGVPVVGMGASAGGVDAFKKFFAKMPADSGLAVVVIPHLDPTHESLMAELLSKQTKMPVVEAKEGMRVEPNHVYIIPPNKYLTIHGGVLQLTGPVLRHSAHTTIDFFLRSLAEDQQERAICIILSGTGTHGTLGLKAVKAAGGMAMVQEPQTAEYDRMPLSAIGTGLVDYILPVERMPDALLKYVQHFYVQGESRPTSTIAAAADHVGQVLALLLARTKHDFRCYRRHMLLRRIERRMGLNFIDRVESYVEYLRNHPEEIKQLTKDLLISVTSFFREPEAFQTLETSVMPEIVRRHESDQPIRVWVPACATGEEAYSIGILLMEQMALQQKTCEIRIFATDIDEDALEVARHGIYPESIAADVSEERLRRFFSRQDEHCYLVNKLLREAVVFAPQNLITDAPFSKLDLVSCRNLLIYLDPEIQHKVITLMHFALNDGGFLFLGPSESIGRQIDLFEVVAKKWRIYKHIGPVRHDRVDFPIMPIPSRRSLPAQPRPSARSINFAEVTLRLVVNEFAPAAVLINRKCEALYFLGPTQRFIAHPTGEPTQDLLALVREELRTKLRAAIQKAVRENDRIHVPPTRLKQNGDTLLVRVSVQPLCPQSGVEGLLLVTFEESTTPERPPRAAESAEDETAVHHLEGELKSTREELQTTVEEMEGANEELKASHEEVMSMNEELQSANEELETSKEELQSLNEELSTVNSQLQDKVEDLEKTNNDLANLLTSTAVATIFLDTEFRIKRFTPNASEILSLIAADIGRPLGDLAPKFHDKDLLRDCEVVLRQLLPIERELPTDEGRWYLRRILPYRTVDNRISGVCITFLDVTQLKRAAENERRLAAVLMDSNDALMVRDADGRILSWNRAAERLYGYTETEALKMRTFDLAPPEKLKESIEYHERLKRGEQVASWETQRRTKDGRLIDVWVTATPLRDERGQAVAVATTERDITDRKQAEKSLREKQETIWRQLAEIEAVYAAAPVGMACIDRELRVLRVNERLAEFNGLPVAAHLGRTLREVVPTMADTLVPICQGVFETGEPVIDVEIHGITKAKPGIGRDWVVSYYPLKDEAGEVLSVNAAFMEITDRKKAEREIQRLNVGLKNLVAERTAELEAEVVERKQAEEALRESVNRLAAVFNHAAEGIVTIDEEGKIESFNQSAEHMFGYSAEEVVGRNIKVLMPSPYHDEHDGYLMNYIQTGIRKIIGIRREVRGRRKDGTAFPLDLAVSELQDDGRRLFIGIIRDLTERKTLEKDVMEIAVEEQRRIGQDLHDGTGQDLTGLGLMAHEMADALKERQLPEAQTATRIAEGLGHVVEQIRGVVRGLIPVEMTAGGLTAALKELATRTGEVSGIACDFACDQPVLLENVSAATDLFRIAQEALTNAVKHGRPKNIAMQLGQNDGRLFLTIHDDGNGLRNDPAESQGMGLRIMRYRAERIGAELTVRPATNGGTLVMCTLIRGEETDGDNRLQGT
jgi:two-component system CheB/CheR fusion protein